MSNLPSTRGRQSQGYCESLHNGFEDDFKNFVSLFCAKNSFTFKSFAQVWNESNFNLIYSGRETVSVMEEFFELMSAIVFEHMMNEKWSFLARACCVYMLYALYSKQPCGVKPCVRVMESDVSRLKCLKEQFKEIDHVQVQYVLCFLLRDGYFRFVMTELPYGLDKSYRKNFDSQSLHSEDIITALSMTNTIKEIFENVDCGFHGLNELFKDYHAAKMGLPESGNEGVPKELQLVDVNVFDKLKDTAVFNSLENEEIITKETVLKRKRRPIYENPVDRSHLLQEPRTSSKVKKRDRNTTEKILKKDYCQVIEESADADSDVKCEAASNSLECGPPRDLPIVDTTE